MVKKSKAATARVGPAPSSPTAYTVELLQLEEVAGRLRVSRDTVRRIIERGELKAIVCGRRLRVPIAALDDYIRRQGV